MPRVYLWYIIRIHLCYKNKLSFIYKNFVSKGFLEFLPHVYSAMIYIRIVLLYQKFSYYYHNQDIARACRVGIHTSTSINSCVVTGNIINIHNSTNKIISPKEKSILHSFVVIPTCISYDVWCIWPNEEYVYEVCDHTRQYMMVYTLDMWPYMKYRDILIFNI